MIAEIGLVTLALSLFAAVYAVVASVYGEWKKSENWVVSGRNAALATFPLLLVSAGVLLIGLVNGEYQISYVWSVSDPSTPLFYRITALWGSQRGSLLFWCLTMSLFTFGAVLLNWRSDRRLMPYAIAFMMATLVFFLGITLFLENPFARWWIDPNTGEAIETVITPANVLQPSTESLRNTAQGLNPLLRHFGMIIHPPMLYLGFVGFVVPFAFAMAALASGDLSTNWIKATRRWSLVAWVFLSLGLVLGGRWAYDVLGWGGYWGWDPVENAAFLPWLVGTAFIHSVMIQQKRGMLKAWNMVLVLATFSAVLFGTFATRSGVIESVHSFARSQIGFPMLLFWSGTTTIGVVLLVYRWRRGELRDERSFTGLLSRESLFVLNNVVFILLTLVIFWGSFGAPIVSELFLGTEITLGTEYFNLVTPPLFAALYVLMGIAPLAAWSTSRVKQNMDYRIVIPAVGAVASVALIGVVDATIGLIALIASVLLLVILHEKIRKALILPLILTVVTVALIAVFMHGDLVALLSYGVVLIGGYVVIVETYRGARARRQLRNESWFTAVRKLFGRNQRRYGGYVVHLGIVIMGVGIIGSTLFQVESRRTVEIGGTTTVENYTLRYEGFERGIAADGRGLNVATLTLFEGDQALATIRPRIDQYPQQAMMIAGAHSNLARDFYVLLDTFDQQANTATFVIYINPLINLVWWGSIVLIIGTVIAAWPRELVPETVRKSQSSAAGARAGAAT